jgi:hypothetical protein
MTELQMDEAAMQEIDAEEISRRYFKVTDLLRYTFKMPSPYGSRRVRVKGRNRRPLRGERIYPVAYRGPTVYEMAPGIATTSGGNHAFLWITSDGVLVIREAGVYRTVTLHVVIASLKEPDYELLILWLSNDAAGALALIERRRQEEMIRMWPELPVFNPGNYT